jgi:hypothetical protein
MKRTNIWSRALKVIDCQGSNLVTAVESDIVVLLFISVEMDKESWIATMH